jgi:hypothetical protein
LWVPAEFRLPEPEFTEEQLDILEELIQLMSPSLSDTDDAIQDERVRMANFLAELGTGIWRVRRKIEDLSRMPKEIKDALYSIESMWISMADGGVEIIDHIGVIPPKREAKVIEIREIAGLTREQVVETIKPTILMQGEVVQQGEVVLGRPGTPQYSAEAAKPAGSYKEENPPDEELPQDLESETAVPDTPTLTSPDEPDTSIIEEPASENVPDSIPQPEPETDALPSAENTADEKSAGEEVLAARPAPDEIGAGSPEAETSSGDEAEIDIPLPRKQTRRKKVLPASVGTKLAEIPEIGKTPEDAEKKTISSRGTGRKRTRAASEGRRKKTDETLESEDGAGKEKA